VLSNEWTVKEFYPIEYLPRGVRLTAYGGDANDLPPVVLAEFLSAVKVGHAAVPIHKSYELVDIAEAHADMEARTASGKLQNGHHHHGDASLAGYGDRSCTEYERGDGGEIRAKARQGQPEIVEKLLTAPLAGGNHEGEAHHENSDGPRRQLHPASSLTRAQPPDRDERPDHNRVIIEPTDPFHLRWKATTTLGVDRTQGSVRLPPTRRRLGNDAEARRRLPWMTGPEPCAARSRTAMAQCISEFGAMLWRCGWSLNTRADLAKAVELRVGWLAASIISKQRQLERLPNEYVLRYTEHRHHEGPKPVGFFFTPRCLRCQSE